MPDALSIALSGLTAVKQRLNASASNIANVLTGGAVPGNDSTVSTVYKPLQVGYSAQTINGQGAGVSANVTEKKNAYSLSYDPTNIYANKDGYIAVPNVDLVEESVNVIESKSLFKANLAVIKTQSDMLGELLDTFS